MVAKHRKVHLFDIDIPGKQTFKVGSSLSARTEANDQESDSLTAGKTITTFSAPFGKIGLGICYDIVRPPPSPIDHAYRLAIPRTRHDRCSTGYIFSSLKINR
jgi:predicted amidohydrolase